MSRPRSGRGASGGAAGARPAAQRGVYVQTPKSDIYVALLGVALGAMIIGCLLLVLVLNRYGFSTKVSLGMGYKMLLQLCDHVWLSTTPEGTVVQVEKKIAPPADAGFMPGLLDRMGA